MYVNTVFIKISNVTFKLLIKISTMNFCKGKVADYLTGIQQFLSDDDSQTLYSDYQYKIKAIHESLDTLPDFGVLGHICDE